MKIIKVLVSMLIGITAIFANGPHDAITCLGCHSAHFAMANKAFGVKNTSSTNPRTGKKIKGLVANRCLGCHQLEENGGAGVRPIHLHITHPIGMVPNPKIADVPESLLNNGRLDCISCHEAHPSNAHFMYLRVDTKRGKNIEHFCVVCHSAKGDLKAMGFKNADDIQVFSAMDQSKGATSGSRSSMSAHNPTPNYIQPLGEVPKNTITPNYLSPPDWIYKPKPKYVKAIQKQMGIVTKKHVEEKKRIQEKKRVEIKSAEKVEPAIKAESAVKAEPATRAEPAKTVEATKKIKSKNSEKNVYYEFNRNGYMYVPTDDDEDYLKINL